MAARVGSIALGSKIWSLLTTIPSSPVILQDGDAGMESRGPLLLVICSTRRARPWNSFTRM
jgi:hypothetical protein